MLKGIWFFIQAAVITAGAIWIAQRPGSVSLEMMSYTIYVKTGYFILFLLVLFICIALLGRFFKVIMNVPHLIFDKSARDKKEKGFQSLTKGLVAVAAGDRKQALFYARQTRALLPKNTGLPIFLEAQAAQLNGNLKEASIRFEELLEDKETSFLGLRGLLKLSLAEKNMKAVLMYAEKAAILYPKQKWVIKGLYGAQLKNNLWHAAYETLYRSIKQGILKKEDFVADMIALHHIFMKEFIQKQDAGSSLKELEKAYALNPYFVPTVMMLGQEHIKKGKNSKALSILKKIWPVNPHPDLMDLWESLTPEVKKKQKECRLKWYESLIDLNPEYVLSYCAAAEAAIDLGLWEVAKTFLLSAEKIMPSALVYRQLAVVYQKTNHSDKEINSCIEKAARALPDKVWVCYESGIIYESWEPVASPHNSFNTIIWDYPQARVLPLSGANRLIENMCQNVA